LAMVSAGLASRTKALKKLLLMSIMSTLCNKADQHRGLIVVARGGWSIRLDIYI
jgi:hypothetical protein